MVHFFIAIAIFLCIFIRKTAEDYRNAEYDRKSKKSDEEANRLDGYTCTREMHDDVEEYVWSGEHYDEICNDLMSDLLFVFGNNWRNTLNIPPHYPHSYPENSSYPSEYHVDWIVALILASKGYLPNDFSDISPFTIYGKGRDFEIGKKFIQRIEYHLNQRGRNVRFVMKKKRDSDHVEFNQEGVAFGETERLW